MIIQAGKELGNLGSETVMPIKDPKTLQTPHSNKQHKLLREKPQENENSMALKEVKSSSSDMTIEEFKEWLKQLDTNKDGQLSREELRQALRKRGVGRIAAFRGAHRVDKNSNGFIDDTEVENLIAFAQKYLGIRVWF
jgi:calmodulin